MRSNGSHRHEPRHRSGHRRGESTAVRIKPDKGPSSKHQRMRKQKEIVEKVKSLDCQLLSFYEFCEQMGFTQDEMNTICSPMNEVMVTKTCFAQMAKSFVILFAIFGVMYGIGHMTPAVVHSTALGRIVLIKMLSFWDWRHLFTEPCLVDNPQYGEYGLTPDDCMTCETIETINIISRTSYKILNDNYFNRDAPVIVTDAMDAWELMKNPLFFKNITKAHFEDVRLLETVPCILTTNLRQGGPDLQSFLKLVDNPDMKKWFVHWQNCDMYAVKALRKFYQKPYFLPKTISPSHSNWIFMSSDYTSRNYKKIDLDYGLIMFIQLKGSSTIRLLPFKPCNELCPELSATLHQGEILVMKNYLWTLEYLPGHGTDNIAILTETTWDQSSV